MHDYNYEICYPSDAFVDPIIIQREPDPPLPILEIGEPIREPEPQETVVRRSACQIAFDTFSATGDWEQAAASAGVIIEEIPEGSGVCVLKAFSPGIAICRPVNDPNFPDHPSTQGYTFPCPWNVSSRPTEKTVVGKIDDDAEDVHWRGGPGSVDRGQSVVALEINDTGTEKSSTSNKSVEEIPSDAYTDAAKSVGPSLPGDDDPQQVSINNIRRRMFGF